MITHTKVRLYVTDSAPITPGKKHVWNVFKKLSICYAFIHLFIYFTFLDENSYLDHKTFSCEHTGLVLYLNNVLS